VKQVKGRHGRDQHEAVATALHSHEDQAAMRFAFKTGHRLRHRRLQEHPEIDEAIDNMNSPSVSNPRQARSGYCQPSMSGTYMYVRWITYI